MARYEITAPDGQRYEVTAPDGATEEDVLSYAKSQFSKPATPATSSVDQVMDITRQGVAQDAQRAPEMTAGRAAGLTGRAGVQAVPSAVLGLPALALDAAESVINMPFALYNLGAQAVGSDKRTNLPYAPFRNISGVAKLGEQAADVIGLPKPETPGERVAVNTGTTALSALTGSGLARTVATRLAPNTVSQTAAQTLAANPIRQTVAAGSGGLAGSVAQEKGASPGTQLAVSLLGSMTPAGLEAGGNMLANATRRALAGDPTQRAQMLQNMALLQGQGVDRPSIGAVTTGGGGRAAQGFVSNIPGGGSVLAANADESAAALGKQASTIAGKLSTRRSADTAGLAIKEGVDKFVQNFRGTQDKLYGNFAKSLDPTTGVPLRNFRAALDSLTAPVEGAENMGQVLSSPTLRQLRAALGADAAGGSQNMFGDIVLPLKTITGSAERGQPTLGLRQLIGNKLANPSLTDDIPRGQLKMLYGALMDDLKLAVEQSGNKQALTALQRADNYTKAGHSRIDSVLAPLADKKVPEQIFEALLQNKGDGATRIRTVMKSLEPAQQKVVAATLLERLGRARPGQQTADGDVFSPRTFLTEINKIDDRAIQATFGPVGVAEDIRKIARASQMLNDANAAMANPSGTARNTAFYGVLTALGTGVATGNPVTGLVVGGSPVVASTVSAKLMTNPRFIKWLGKQTTLPPSALPGQLKALEASFRNEPDENRAAVDDFANALRSLGE